MDRQVSRIKNSQIELSSSYQEAIKRCPQQSDLDGSRNYRASVEHTETSSMDRESIKYTETSLMDQKVVEKLLSLILKNLDGLKLR